MTIKLYWTDDEWSGARLVTRTFARSPPITGLCRRGSTNVMTGLDALMASDEDDCR